MKKEEKSETRKDSKMADNKPEKRLVSTSLKVSVPPKWKNKMSPVTRGVREKNVTGVIDKKIMELEMKLRNIVAATKKS